MGIAAGRRPGRDLWFRRGGAPISRADPRRVELRPHPAGDRRARLSSSGDQFHARAGRAQRPAQAARAGGPVHRFRRHHHRRAADREHAADRQSARRRVRHPARLGAAARRRCPAARVRRRRPGGDRTRLPARALDRVRAAGAARRALPRRAKPGLVGRAHQPLSPHQAARTDMTVTDAPDLLTPAATDADRLAARLSRPEIVLKSSEFRKGREAGWRELEGLVTRVERRGVRSLSLDELQRLPILYRAALSSLSVARTIALDRNLLLYLEDLALRAFLAVYGPRANPLEGLADFFGRELPAAVRSARWHILIAALALIAGN